MQPFTRLYDIQVGTADLDSNNPSARGSLVPNSGSSHKGDHVVCDEPIPNNHKHATSYIEDDILNVLRRNIITDTVDTEFNLKVNKYSAFGSHRMLFDYRKD